MFYRQDKTKNTNAINKKNRFNILMASVACFAFFAPNSALFAQDSSNQNNEVFNDEQPVDTIISTGTRRTARTQYQSLSPIDVINRDALSNTATDEVGDSLTQVLPSFNMRRLPMSDGLVFVRPATLRNLSPDHTLVLVNGKRLHRSALLGSNGAQSADLGQIPSSAIKRVEVLRDGASAQYGSDAIAGVVNIILEDYEGVRGFVQGSQYYKGDGDQYRGGLQAGTTFDGGGYINATFEFSDAALTSRSRQRPDAIAFQAANPDVKLLDPVQRWGKPERTIYRVALNSAKPITEDLEVYLFGTWGVGSGVSDFNWRNPATNNAFGTSAIDPDYDLYEIYPGGFSPQFGQDDKDFSINGGLKGDLNDKLSFDLSSSFGRNEIDYFISNTINASLGSDSPTSFDPGNLTQKEFNLNLDFGYELDVTSLDNPVNIAFGAERREETYGVIAGDPASYAIGPLAVEGFPSGSNGFSGFSPIQAGSFSQESYAGYVDVDVPLTDNFTVGVATRYEDYSEFGDSLTGKLSARYDLTDEFAIRGTVSNGFRASTPGQLFSESTSQGLDTTTLQLFTNGRFSPSGPIAAIINKRDGVNISALTPEESVNISVGFTYRNDMGFSTTLDLYQIDVDNRFGTSDTFNVTAAERAELTALGVANAVGLNGVNFFQNVFDTRTRGLDFVGTYSTSTGEGDVSLTLAYNYNDTEVLSGPLLGNETAKVTFEESLPKHSGNVSIQYTIADFDILGRVRYYGGWTNRSGNATGDVFQKFGGEAFADLTITYHVSEQINLKFGAENLFNNYPAEATFQSNRGLLYARNSPYDTNGGSYYLRLNFEL